MVELTKQLNQNLSDVQVLYVKLHNYHWNIKGQLFFGIHKQTEEYYEYFATVYDDIAERILQIGGKPLVTVKSYLETAKISEEGKTEFSASEVLISLLDDFNYLLKEFKKTSQLASGKNDMGTQMMADEKTAWLEKTIWMLNSSKG